MSGPVWAHTVIVPKAMLLDDPPAVEAFVQQQGEAALLAAHEQGVTINGPVRLMTEPAYMLDTDDGPIVVGEAMALAAGASLSGSIGQRVTMEWFD